MPAASEVPEQPPVPGGREATRPLPELLGAAAIVGAGTGLLLAALQLVSAAAARMLWTLEMPALGLAAYPLLGALAAVSCVPALMLLRRVVAPRTDALAWVVGCTCLGAGAGRALASAAARTAGPARRTARRARAQGAAWIVLALAGAACSRGARGRTRVTWPRLRSPRCDGGAPDRAPRRVGSRRDASAARWRAPLVHLALLAVKDAAAQRGLLGAPALLLVVGASSLGAALGLLATSRTPVRRVAGAILTCGVVAGLFVQRPDPPSASVVRGARGPNVLLIVLDTLRRDAVSAYGLVDGTTPRLDALASKGVLCDDVVAPGDWTVPVHASLFTGAQVSRHGTGHGRRVLRERPAAGAPPLPTLAELFARRGWETAAFVCNMNVSRAAGFARGFERYEEVWRARQGDFDALGPALRAWLGLGGAFDKGGELAVRGVGEFLDEHADARRPWLLFVNLMEAHAPYTPPAPWAGRFVEHAPSDAARALLADPLAHVWDAGVEPPVADELWRAYLGGVAYQDALLGEILDALVRNGLDDDTLVVVTSDHGEHFGKRGLLGHGQDLDDDLLDVPLVLAGPGLPRGVREPAPLDLLDVLPTLLALSGGDALPSDPGRTGRALRFDGRDAAALADRPRVAERFAFSGDASGVDADDALPPGADPEWSWGRAALLRGRDLYVEVDAPPDAARAFAATRLERRDGDPRPPRDDGRHALDDAELRAAYAAELAALRARWTSADAPRDALEPDAERDAALRALGYTGR
ncbi:MAG: sulfatase [Planctomycetes bacterium]|nr:sulfatase [Planctomycetota bacterium]